MGQVSRTSGGASRSPFPSRATCGDGELSRAGARRRPSHRALARFGLIDRGCFGVVGPTRATRLSVRRLGRRLQQRRKSVRWFSSALLPANTHWLRGNAHQTDDRRPRSPLGEVLRSIRLATLPQTLTMSVELPAKFVWPRAFASGRSRLVIGKRSAKLSLARVV
jgi:hypothetical protein